MVNLYINDERIDLQGKETIAGSYAIAPFSDISKRTSFQTISFNVPKTANNRRIFENANVIVNDSVLPYAFLKARLDVDGIDQRIRSAELVSVKGEFQLKLFGGNIDFFSLVKDSKLSALDLSAYNHYRFLLTEKDSQSNTSGYIYPVQDLHSDSVNSYINDTDAEIDGRYLYPAFYLHTLVEEIISQAGFTSSGDFFTDTFYRTLAIQCVNIRFIRATIENAVTFSSVSVNTDPQTIHFFSNTDDLTVKAGSLITISRQSHTDTITVRVTEDLFISSDLLGLNFPQLEVVSSSGLALSSSTPLYSTSDFKITGFVAGQTYDYSCEIDLESEASLNSFFQVSVYKGFSGLNDINIMAINIGQDMDAFIDIAASLPEMKQADVIKAVAQMFGLFITVDNENKIVYFNRFTEIIDNKQNALDWTDKVDYSEPTEINFKDTSYGQINSCEYKEDDSVVKPQGTDYNVLIENTTLKPENKLIELPFAASESVTRFNGYETLNIKIFTEAGTAQERIENVQPRIIALRDVSFSPAFEFTDGGSPLYSTTVKMSYFIDLNEVQNLGFEISLIPTYSQEIFDTIIRYKMIVALLRLNVLDINQLDFTIPVWIEFRGDSGAYFYISEIKQFKFTSKESTEVELIKLP